MTIQALNSIIKLHTELERNSEMLDSIRSKAYSASTPNLSGMPHGSGINKKTEVFAIEIAELETRNEELQAEIAKIRDEISDYCKSVPDMKIRVALRMRFLHYMTWKEVAGILGKYYTTESVKTMCYSYIRNPDGKKATQNLNTKEDCQQLSFWIDTM